MKSKKDQNSSWCLVSVGGNQVKARISHIGGGKFKIIEDNQGGRYSNVRVDALDVFHCRE